jgi:hypothetical protein
LDKLGYSGKDSVLESPLCWYLASPKSTVIVVGGVIPYGIAGAFGVVEEDIDGDGPSYLLPAAALLELEIFNFFQTLRTNAILEGFNSKISIIKSRSRGFKNMRNFMNMIYFVCGELSLPLQPIM